MSLETWLKQGKLKAHQSNAEEVASLFKVIDRDIADAAVEQLSEDRRFATAYNAALQLATIALLASGYRPSQRRPWSSLDYHHIFAFYDGAIGLAPKSVPVQVRNSGIARLFAGGKGMRGSIS